MRSCRWGLADFQFYPEGLEEQIDEAYEMEGELVFDEVIVGQSYFLGGPVTVK